MAQPYTTTGLTGQQGQYLLSTYYDSVLLQQFKQNMVLYGLGQVKSVPMGGGNIVKWSRYTLMPAGSPLTEGTAPTPTMLSASNVTATLTQFGGTTQVSDVMTWTAVDSQIQSAVEQMGYQAAITLDTYARNTLIGLTGNTALSSTDFYSPGADSQITRNALLIKYFGDRATLSGVVSTNKLTVNELIDCSQYLHKLNAPTFSDGTYKMVTDPVVISDLMQDTTAVVSWAAWNNATPQGQERMASDAVGKIAGIEIFQSTNTWHTNSGTGATTSAYYSPIVGPAAFGVVDFAGQGGVKTYVVQPNNYDSSNPLQQWTVVGWKWSGACRVLNVSGGIISVVGSTR